MSDGFDPYYTWLGIPPHEQPANHYRLLGISLFESNPEVISNAADRLMLHLRAFQTGKRAKESQQLLNEISAARVCLLNPQQKTVYDRNLRAAQPEVQPPPPAEAVLPPMAGPVANVAISPQPPAHAARTARGSRRPSARPKALPPALWLAIASSVVLLLGAGIGWYVLSRKGGQTTAQVPSPTTGNDTPDPSVQSPKTSGAAANRQQPEPPSNAIPPTEAPTPQNDAPAGATPPAVTPAPVPSTAPPAPPPATAPPPAPPPAPPSETNPPPDAPLVRPPDAAAVAKAAADVQSKYAGPVAAAKRADQKLALARAIRDEAQSANSDPPRQVALWLEAQRLAVVGGDLRTAVSMLRDRVERFSLDLLPEIVELLKTAVFPASLRSENATLADLASQFLDQAIAEDRFDVAEPLRKIASQAYGKLKNVDSVNRLNMLQTELTTMKSEHDKLGSSLQKLAAAPSDPEANLAVGRYQCFYKNDWRQGLPKLAQGSDADLAAVARKDADNPKAPPACAEVAELWWTIGQKLPQAAKRTVNRRVAEWYLIALPGLKGNQRAAALRRIEQGLPPRGDQPTALVNQGLIGYWNFDEGSGRLAQDLTKSKNHALLAGADWTRGVWGTAMQSLTPNEYAHFFGAAQLNPWTISLWTKIERMQGDAGLLMTTGNDPGNVQLYIRSDGFVQANIINAGGSAPRVKIEPGRWHHIVLRYIADSQAANAEVFVDGELDNKFALNKDIRTIIGPARIGGWSDDDSGRTFLGAIDEVRLYGRPLTDPEIALLYAAGQPAQ